MNPTPVIDMFSGTGGHRTYLDLDLARWLSEERGYRTTVSSAGAWEVGARLLLQHGLTAINDTKGTLR